MAAMQAHAACVHKASSGADGFVLHEDSDPVIHYHHVTMNNEEALNDTIE
jgi:hypothetical protein